MIQKLTREQRTVVERSLELFDRLGFIEPCSCKDEDGSVDCKKCELLALKDLISTATKVFVVNKKIR